MITVQTEIAEKVACICCGAEKYATQSPYLCHNCWKNGEAAKLIQQLTQRAPDAPKPFVNHCIPVNGVHAPFCNGDHSARG